jgi:hypothetical protein
MTAGGRLWACVGAMLIFAAIAMLLRSQGAL